MTIFVLNFFGFERENADSFCFSWHQPDCSVDSAFSPNYCAQSASGAASGVGESLLDPLTTFRLCVRSRRNPVLVCMLGFYCGLPRLCKSGAWFLSCLISVLSVTVTKTMIFLQTFFALVKSSSTRNGRLLGPLIMALLQARLMTQVWLLRLLLHKVRSSGVLLVCRWPILCLNVYTDLNTHAF